jgi:hypothetical protein
MAYVHLHDLKAYARSLAGQTLETMTQRKQFTVDVSATGFTFTPASTAKPRTRSDRKVQRVLERYHEQRSLRPMDYQDMTVNASYILTILQRYLDARR